MAVEIERKFLVYADRLPALVDGQRIVQGYIATADRTTVRVRLSDQQAWLTLKGMTTGISRAEFEYPIPAEDARLMLDQLCNGGHVEKTRYRIAHGLTWELDVFEGDNIGLIVAELELSSEAQAFERPEWVGQEVSHDPRYSNLVLARHPYQQWECHGTDTPR